MYKLHPKPSIGKENPGELPCTDPVSTVPSKLVEMAFISSPLGQSPFGPTSANPLADLDEHKETSEKNLYLCTFISPFHQPKFLEISTPQSIARLSHFLEIKTPEVPANRKPFSVVPIFMEGKKEDLKIYRPSNFSACKIMKKIVLEGIEKHLEDNAVIGNSQHDFMTGNET
ncbi:hypothetical protein WISP_88161 [Willisornis vidua]|uniref:Reverse transcriptase domain-containing protein n=1 Tax=Willisornis vidua TaxID=1566151 RepID=A0ABQ9D875_9PASS|nr:hypothetical protein WISP_88161 [Willisornis vidua]